MRLFEPTPGGIYESPAGKRFLFIGPVTSFTLWCGYHAGTDNPRFHCYSGLHRDLVVVLPTKLGTRPSFEQVCAQAKIADCGATPPITRAYKLVGTVDIGTAAQSCERLRTMALSELKASAGDGEPTAREICRASEMCTVRPYGGQLPINQGRSFAAFKPYFEQVASSCIEGTKLPGGTDLSGER
jgi:hypothetical protein